MNGCRAAATTALAPTAASRTRGLTHPGLAALGLAALGLAALGLAAPGAFRTRGSRPQAPWYIYIIAIVVALPCFALWALGGYGLVRAILFWVTNEPMIKGARQ